MAGIFIPGDNKTENSEGEGLTPYGMGFGKHNHTIIAALFGE